MSALSVSKLIIADFLSSTTQASPTPPNFPCFSLFQKSLSFPHSVSHSQRKTVFCFFNIIRSRGTTNRRR
ncbi:hypothetical protein CRYUN_Cryun13aG0083500 [Craigia yunnanensis]